MDIYSRSNYVSYRIHVWNIVTSSHNLFSSWMSKWLWLFVILRFQEYQAMWGLVCFVPAEDPGIYIALKFITNVPISKILVDVQLLKSDVIYSIPRY